MFKLGIDKTGSSIGEHTKNSAARPIFLATTLLEPISWATAPVEVSELQLPDIQQQTCSRKASGKDWEESLKLVVNRNDPEEHGETAW